jgi:hypothetical protein
MVDECIDVAQIVTATRVLALAAAAVVGEGMRPPTSPERDRAKFEHGD